MELKPNMYVRTKDGYIDKILLVEYAEEKRQQYPNHPSKKHWRDKILLLKAGYWRTTQNIIKASHNIIDLIEPEDYVNGVEVIGKEFDNFNEEYLQCGVGDYVICTYNSNEIEDVVTKEQFSAMEYRLGDDK